MAADRFSILPESSDRPAPDVNLGAYRVVLGGTSISPGCEAAKLVAPDYAIGGVRKLEFRINFGVYHGDTPEEVVDLIRADVLAALTRHAASTAQLRANGNLAEPGNVPEHQRTGPWYELQRNSVPLDPEAKARD